MQSIIFLLLITTFVTSTSYDAIVIGTGASGSLTCGLLSSNPNFKTACLENGYDVSNNEFLQHQTINDLTSPPHPYLTTILQKITSTKQFFQYANAFGGGPTISSSAATWPSPVKYQLDYIERAGLNPAKWGFSEIKKCLKWMENYKTPFDQTPAYLDRGKDGFITITKLNEHHSPYAESVHQLFNTAVNQTGFVNDLSVDFIGFGVFQRNIKLNPDNTTTRTSPWTELVRPYIEERGKLDIFPGTTVHKILFKSGTGERVARGVLANVEGEMKTLKLKPNGKIFLSAGAINSPKVLMLSGVGDCDYLDQFGIDCVSNITSIGKEVKDHRLVVDYQFNPFDEGFVPIVEGNFYSPYHNGNPDVQIAYTQQPAPGGSVFVSTVLDLDSEETGRILLSSPNPNDDVVLDMSFTTGFDSLTGKRLRWGYEIILNATSQLPPMFKITEPGRKDVDITNLHETVGSDYHYGNTVPLGKALDEDGKVMGLSNVYVTDGGIIPSTPSTHPSLEIYANTAVILKGVYDWLDVC